jgi:hypothetical protein
LPVADTHLTVVGANAVHQSLLAEALPFVRKSEEGTHCNPHDHFAFAGFVLRLQVLLRSLRTVLQKVLDYLCPVAADGLVGVNLLRLQGLQPLPVLVASAIWRLRSVSVREQGGT